MQWVRTLRVGKPLFFLLLLVAAIGTGCVTTPKVDWDRRVGNYSYDQAVLEFGPPDKAATLTDGTRVAEWLTSRGYAQGYVPTFGPYFAYPYFSGPPSVYFSEPPSPDRFLRLTFAPDGKLAAWKKIYK